MNDEVIPFFLLHPLLSSDFVQKSLQEGFLTKGELGRRAFCMMGEEPWTSLSSISKIEVGHFRFVCFSFVNMFFLPIGF